MTNLNDPEPTETRDHAGFEARRTRLGWALKTERLGLGMWTIEPGQAAYPYHYHLVEEEAIVVLAGTPSVRTSDGWKELAEGDVLSFLTGERGAHQIVNWSATTARFLAISTSGQPDIVMYPDSQKIGVMERFPDRRGLFTLFPADAEVPYHHGETPPLRPVV